MKSMFYSKKKDGFSATHELFLPRVRGTPSTQLNTPILGYRAFFTGEIRLFWGSEKWGVVIPEEAADSPIIMPISTRKSDAGASIQITWRAIEDPTEYTSELIPISEPGNVEFVPIPEQEIRRFSDKTVNVTYQIALNDKVEISPTLKIAVAPKLIYQPAIIQGVVNGELNVSDYPDGLKITIPPITNYREYNALQITWRVLNPDTNERAVWFSKTVRLSNPDKNYIFTLTPDNYFDYPGHPAFFQWYIWVGAEMDERLIWSTGVTDLVLK